MASGHDIGAATLLVLPSTSGHLAADDLLLPGGGRADVFVDEDGDTLVQVGPEPVTSEELAIAVLRAPTFSPRGDDVELAVVGEHGHDRWAFSADLRHRLLLKRVWQDRAGPSVAVVGLAPPAMRRGSGLVGDTVAIVASHGDGAPSSVAEVHVFSRRVEPDDQPGRSADDRVADGGLRAAALVEADLVLCAWGVVPPSGLGAVEQLVEELRAARDAGARVVLAGRDGEPRTVGDPAQPTADLATGGPALVEAPSDWLWGGPLA